MKSNTIGSDLSPEDMETFLKRANELDGEKKTDKKLNPRVKKIVVSLRKDHGYSYSVIQQLLLEKENVDISISALSAYMARVNSPQKPRKKWTKKEKIETQNTPVIQKDVQYPYSVKRSTETVEIGSETIVSENTNFSRVIDEKQETEAVSEHRGIVRIRTAEENARLKVLMEKKKREGKLSSEELYEFGQLTTVEMK